MGILKAIQERRSIRQYKKDPIPEDDLLRVVEAARLAPSGKNLQPWKFIIVRDEGLKQRLARASSEQYFIAEAPVIIVACGFPDDCYERMGQYMKSWTVDVAIALEHLILQAQEDGFGTCWIGSFREEEVKSILNIPEDVKVLALTPLGYPAEAPPYRGRKRIDEIVSYDGYEAG